MVWQECRLFLGVQAHLQASFFEWLDHGIAHLHLIKPRWLLGDRLDGDPHVACAAVALMLRRTGGFYLSNPTMLVICPPTCHSFCSRTCRM
jgi:hypothetical protein